MEYQTINGVSRPMLRGSLYGYTVSGDTITGAVYLKSLTDGVPNPRTYNNLPTIIQAYYSGGQSVGGSVFTLYNGTFIGILPIVDNSYPGVSLVNIEINGIGTWDAGVQSFRLNYLSQSVKTEAFVYFAN